MIRHDRPDVPAALRAAAAEVHAATAVLDPVPPRIARRAMHTARGAAHAARRPRPVLAAVSVAVAVAAVVLGLSSYLGGTVRTAPPAARDATPAGRSPSSGPSASAVVPTAATASSTTAPVCGTRLPVPVYPPKGWAGPRPGPADGSPAPAGLLVLHWTGPEGSVEVRYPSSLQDSAPYDPRESMSVGGEGSGATLSLPVPDKRAQCSHLSAQWTGKVPSGFGEAVNGFGNDAVVRALAAFVTPPASLRLVTSTRTVAKAPATPVPCSGGSVPTTSGSVSLSAQPTPEQALQGFLDSGSQAVGGFNRSGWTKFVLPGGGAAFGVPLEGGPGWVQLVYLSRTANGWVVDRWAASGC